MNIFLIFTCNGANCNHVKKINLESQFLHVRTIIKMNNVFLILMYIVKYNE